LARRPLKSHEKLQTKTKQTFSFKMPRPQLVVPETPEAAIPASSRRRSSRRSTLVSTLATASLLRQQVLQTPESDRSHEMSQTMISESPFSQQNESFLNKSGNESIYFTLLSNNQKLACSYFIFSTSAYMQKWKNCKQFCRQLCNFFQ
jgi:hypothetical protein